MPKFRNKTNQDLAIPGIGIVKAGQIVDCPEGFHNGNFEKSEARETNNEKPSEIKPSENLNNNDKQNE